MAFKKIFENNFPRNLRIRYRGILNSKVINENLVYLYKMNKLNSVDYGCKYIERIKKQAKNIG